MNRQALLDTGARAYAAGRFADAAISYRAIIAQGPGDAEALSNLGAVLTAAQCPEAAETACRAALQARPRYWAALANLGNALHRQQRYPEAVNAYYAAVEANPRNASAWTNLGVALNEQWDMENALIAHKAAVALAPADPQIRCNRAMALLMAGDFANGFAEFEWRWRTPGMVPHGLAQPQWRGGNLAGKTILLHAEGGFGDTLQFIRYAPALAAGTIIAKVQTGVLRLLRRNFPAVTFTDAENLPPHDVQCPMLSLPHAARTTLQSMPPGPPYLTACPQAAAQWRARLAALGAGPKIGLAWAGAPLLGMAEFRAMNARRSIPFAALAPLGDVAGIHLISLQAGEPPSGPIPPMFDPMPGIADFEDTAALIETLDLVISADTAVAHLAGALGKPVWLLSRFDACWRWLANRQDSPWYPAMQVFRQPQPGDWTTVIDAVSQRLRALA